MPCPTNLGVLRVSVVAMARQKPRLLANLLQPFSASTTPAKCSEPQINTRAGPGW
jgi:hypothetical protein